MRGSELKSLRLAAGVRREALAARLGITARRLAEIESGTKPLDEWQEKLVTEALVVLPRQRERKVDRCERAERDENSEG